VVLLNLMGGVFIHVAFVGVCKWALGSSERVPFSPLSIFRGQNDDLKFHTI
jgi:hypothetical protein